MEAIKITPELLTGTPKLRSLQDSIMDGMLRCEEETLIKVLTQFLGRTPTIEDFKRCQKFTYENVFDSYLLAYDGRKLGTIKHDFGYNLNHLNYKTEYSVIFTPSSSE